MPRLLFLNAGSSSLKWSVVDMPAERRLAFGDQPLAGKLPDLKWIRPRAGEVDAVVHRVVHGGPALRSATRIDRVTERVLASLVLLDPLHAPRALEVLAAAKRLFPGLPQIACFDTGFHSGLPTAAATYALPRNWNRRFGLRRYGFHGLSVAHAVRRAGELIGRPPRYLLVCHLGSGCSITAVARGRSVDTTMGFTPLEGLVMGTRSGSIDPGLALHLLRRRLVTQASLSEALQRKSGLLGLSGQTADFRKLRESSRQGSTAAALACDVFLASLRRHLGAMLGALSGLDAVVFTGGIGENDSRVRADAVAPFRWMGIEIDPGRNKRAAADAIISKKRSKVAVLRIESREDLTMARETMALLGAPCRS